LDNDEKVSPQNYRQWVGNLPGNNLLTLPRPNPVPKEWADII